MYTDIRGKVQLVSFPAESALGDVVLYFFMHALILAVTALAAANLEPLIISGEGNLT